MVRAGFNSLETSPTACMAVKRATAAPQLLPQDAAPLANMKVPRTSATHSLTFTSELPLPLLALAPDIHSWSFQATAAPATWHTHVTRQATWSLLPLLTCPTAVKAGFMVAPVTQAETARAAQICMKSPSAAKIPVTKRKVPTISAMLAVVSGIE